MIRVLFFVALLILLALGAHWLADRPGDVVITWQGYRVETSVAVAAVAVLAFGVGVALVWSVVRLVLRLPSLIAIASRDRRRAQGYQAISRGMIAIGAGDPVVARREAAQARRQLGAAPLALLLEAQTAQITGDGAGAEAAFKEMLSEPQTRVLGLRGLFVEARRRGDEAAAIAYAQEAAKLAPGADWAMEAALIESSRRGDYATARTLVDRRAGLRLLARDEGKRARAALNAAQARDLAETAPAQALDLALDAVKLNPGLVPAATLAGRLLSRRGDLRKAMKVLEAAWKLNPHPDLAEAYLDVRPGDSTRDRLARARTLEKLKPGHAESRLAVAQAAIAALEFAQARDALRPLIEDRPTARVYLAAAELEEAEHGPSGRSREWLARAARAPRDPVWVADGVVSRTWQPISPVTGRIDAFVWMTPPGEIESSAGSARADAGNHWRTLDSDAVLLDVAEAPEPVVPPSPAPPAESARATGPMASQDMPSVAGSGAKAAEIKPAEAKPSDVKLSDAKAPETSHAPAVVPAGTGNGMADTDRESRPEPGWSAAREPALPPAVTPGAAASAQSAAPAHEPVSGVRAVEAGAPPPAGALQKDAAPPVATSAAPSTPPAPAPTPGPAPAPAARSPGLGNSAVARAAPAQPETPPPIPDDPGPGADDEAEPAPPRRRSWLYG